MVAGQKETGVNQLLRKLQLKDRREIFIHGAPAELSAQMARGSDGVKVLTAPRTRKAPFALFFVQSAADVARLARRAADMVPGDDVLWFAYPKKSSRRYRTDISRDHGWAPLGALGFEGVRQVAIDDDWSALRFRRQEYVNKLTRAPQRAMSAAGKARAAGALPVRGRAAPGRGDGAAASTGAATTRTGSKARAARSRTAAGGTPARPAAGAHATRSSQVAGAPRSAGQPTGKPGASARSRGRVATGTAKRTTGTPGAASVPAAARSRGTTPRTSPVAARTAGRGQNASRRPTTARQDGRSGGSAPAAGTRARPPAGRRR
jgi:hypothetical protein